MLKKEKDQVEYIVRKLLSYRHLEKSELAEEKINEFQEIRSVDDCIDEIMLFVDKLVEESVISKEIFEDNSYIIYKLNEDKYKSSEDLINRLEWLRQMNMENQEMSLSENHELILKTFSKFNK